MNRIKLFIIILGIFGSIFTSNLPTFAEMKIGLVDMAKIAANYQQAKDAQVNLHSNHKEIQKMIADAKKQLEKVESDKEKKKIEKELSEKIVKKNDALKKDFSEKWQNIQKTVLTTVKKVAKQNNFDIIVNKQSVVVGGEDITDKVLSELK